MLTMFNRKRYKLAALVLILTFLIGCTTLTNVPNEVGSQNPDVRVANTKPSLVLKEAYADILTDIRFSGVYGIEDIPSEDTPPYVIPTVLYYHVTVKNEGKEIIAFRDYQSQFDSMEIIDNIGFYLSVGEELVALLPELHDGKLSVFKGQTSHWAMLPGEVMEFRTRFRLGVSKPNGIEFIPQLPEQETLEKIQNFAYNASLVVKDTENNEEIVRLDLQNYVSNTPPKSMIRIMDLVSEEDLERRQKEAMQLQSIIKQELQEKPQ